MKKALAWICYLIGITRMMDWILFWIANENLALLKYPTFKQKYMDRFPDSTRFLFNTNPEIATLIVIFLFLISAIILWKENNKFVKFIAFSSLFFAFWNLFSLI